ncbi:MAG: UrcA family protein [Gammaproteobacteria bacterium]|nr:UrcA family protein [Gammaproteobacteria bacterium]MDH4254268.1 UrcA family protein [Gammaproteobacteria bacterium]MDH5311114.1 UrcA family protein [Gammaproteobacteria bacterium]
MNKAIVRKVFVSGSMALLLSQAVAALASNPAGTPEPVSIRVSVADLNLQSAEGVDTLYWRLKSAANTACGSMTLREAGSLRQASLNKQCYEDLLDKAVKEANNKLLDEIHAG